MAIKKTSPANTSVVTPDGTVVIEEAKHLSFANLQEAISALVGELRTNEASKLDMARIVDAIDRQQLFLEAGCTSMKAFFPLLLERTASVGWKSATSIKRYLAFYRLYVLQLNFAPTTAIKAASHLHTLYRLAALDRKSGELVDPETEGKLNPVEFEDICRLVAYLVELPDPALRAKVAEGVSAEDLLPFLGEARLLPSAQAYIDIMGIAVALPAKGWNVTHTEAIVAKVASKAEDEPSEALVQVFVGYETFDGSIFVERIDYRNESGEAVEAIPVKKTYSKARFAQLKGRNKAEVSKDEQGDDE